MRQLIYPAFSLALQKFICWNGAIATLGKFQALAFVCSFFDTWDYRLKRLLDFVGAAIGIILLAPLFIVVAIAIELSSPGNVFYSQERIGLHGQVFRMWKFRSMCADAEHRQTELEQLNESKDGVMFKISRDPRIIPIGYFIRRTSIDELPQLFNVLIGTNEFGRFPPFACAGCG